MPFFVFGGAEVVRYSILGSGSCGNGYIFSFEGQSILVDCGYSFKQMLLRMEQGGFTLDPVQALFLTHLHPDHFDMASDGTAGAKLDKSVPLFVQNEREVGVMKKSGFADVRMLTDDGVTFNGVTLKRTYAKHGTKEPCGPASGIFFTAPGEKKTLWILGDTIWCDEVAKTMAELKPDVVILNACAAQLKTYGRLIMDDSDVESVCRAAPNATVIASHMDTVAHASLTRKTLKAALERRGLVSRVLMPDDGEAYVF